LSFEPSRIHDPSTVSATRLSAGANPIKQNLPTGAANVYRNHDMADKGVAKHPASANDNVDHRAVEKSEPASGPRSLGSEKTHCSVVDSPAQAKCRPNAPTVHHTHPHRSHENEKTKKTPRRSRHTPFPTVLPRWERLEKEHRIRVIQVVLKSLGVPYCFTVNLDHGQVRRIQDRKKTFSTVVNEYLAEALGPLEKRWGITIPYWFVIEVSRNGVHHLHGGLALPFDLADELPLLKNIDQAMQRVAGGHVRGAGRYFVMLDRADPNKSFAGDNGALGWGNYAIKELDRSEKRQLGSPFVCRRSLNQQVRQKYDRMILYRREHPKVPA
jgi:hypothetical protein